MFKKALCIILAMVMLVALPACNGGDGGDTVSSDSDTTTVQPPEEEKEDLKITVADLAKYVIVTPKSASDAVSGYAGKLANTINEKFSISMDTKTDFIKEGSPMFKESEFEILIGVCDREASQSMQGDLKYLDYAYKAIGTKLVICAVSDDAIFNAIEHFKTNVIEKSGTDSESVFFSNESNAYSYQHNYPLDDIKIEGSSIKDYVLVYPHHNRGKENDVAIMIRNKVRELVGYDITITKDLYESEGKEIHVGTVEGDTAFVESLKLDNDSVYFGKNADGDIVLTSNTPSGVVHAADMFVSALEADAPNDIIELKADLGKVKIEKTETLSVMTYNIQMWAPWTAGKPEATMQVIIDKDPDLFGVQESTLPNWGDILRNQFSDTYGCVDLVSLGVDAADYPITENSIFYKKDKFTLIESGNKWLTDTPDVASKFEDSAAIRTFIYAVLERKSDGLRFVFVNTHLDNIAAKPEQAAVLVKYLKEHFPEYPILMIGDFNSIPSSDAYNVIIDSGYMNAKYLCTEVVNGDIGTFASSSHKELDHCFFSGRRMCFSKYEVIKDRTFNGTTPSDHYAVYLEFQFCN